MRSQLLFRPSLLILWTLLLLALCLQQAAASTVKSVRIWPAPDHTRIVFDLDKPVGHKVFSLEGPDRLVIDLDQTNSKTDITALPLKNTPISKIRTAVRNGSDMRVVLDLKEKIRPRSLVLKPNKQYGDRLVIDLIYKNKAKLPKVVRQQAAKPEGARDIIIAVDAGHGGDDPGAIGPGGVQEKAIVLAIARKVETLLKKERGLNPVMIRTNDYYVELDERASRARRYRADLFVSIHADAFPDHRPRGSSVFALSQRGATSETAKWLAESENRSDLIGGADGELKLDDKDRVLAEVLLDLTMTATLSDSLKVGQSVLRSIGGINKLHKRDVEQAYFKVLKSPDVPSILIETGFISNPREAKNLQSSSFQWKMARSIVTGIKKHFEANPLPGTLLAYDKQKRDARQYVVARGDTLSGIAMRNKVSVGSLKKANKLRSDTVYVGQRLQIPRS